MKIYRHNLQRIMQEGTLFLLTSTWQVYLSAIEVNWNQNRVDCLNQGRKHVERSQTMTKYLPENAYFNWGGELEKNVSDK